MGSGCAGKSYALSAADLESSASARLEHTKTGALDDRPAKEKSVKSLHSAPTKEKSVKSLHSEPTKEKSIHRLYQDTYWDCRNCGAPLTDTSQALCAACYKEEPGHAPVFVPRSPDARCASESLPGHPSSPSFAGRRTTGSKDAPGRTPSKGDALARSESKRTQDAVLRSESKRTQEAVPSRTSSKHTHSRAQSSSKEVTDRHPSKELTDRHRSGSKEASDRRLSSSKELAVRAPSKRSTGTAATSAYSSMDSNLKDEARHPFSPDDPPFTNTSGPTSPEAARRASGHKDHHHHGHHHHHHHDKQGRGLSGSEATEMLSTLVDSAGHKLNLQDRVIGEGKIGEEMGLGSITGAGDSHGHGMVIVRFDWGGREHPMKAEHLTRLDGKHEAEIRRRLEKQHKDAKH